MADVLRNYINKVVAVTDFKNKDVVTIETRGFTEAGDVFTLEERTIAPSLIQTTRDLQELNPETSNTFPYKIVPPKDQDGATILLSPSVDSPVTASQNYYVPIYSERYNIDIIRFIEKDFTELTI
jgi:hypothetical protein